MGLSKGKMSNCRSAPRGNAYRPIEMLFLNSR